MPHTIHGNWSGASDHSPVVLSTKLRRETKDCLSFTPMAVRKDPELLEAAGEIYRRTLPPAFAQLDRAATPEQVSQAMECLELSLKQPWAIATTLRSHRFKTLWTTQLDLKAKGVPNCTRKRSRVAASKIGNATARSTGSLNEKQGRTKLSASASFSSASLSTVPLEPPTFSAGL